MENQLNAAHVGAVFVEIAQTADTIKRLSELLHGNRIDTMDDERAIQSGVAVLAERIGMLADLGAGRLGQPAVLGGVANWAMPYIRDWPDGPPGALAAQVGEG